MTWIDGCRPEYGENCFVSQAGSGICGLQPYVVFARSSVIAGELGNLFKPGLSLRTASPEKTDAGLGIGRSDNAYIAVVMIGAA